MSDTRSLTRRPGGGLRGQLVEAVRNNPGSIPQDVFVMMEERDNRLIEDELLHGQRSAKYVYRFNAGEGEVSGISVIGARELAAWYKGIKHTLLTSTTKEGPLFIMQTFNPPDIRVNYIEELADQPDFYEAVVEITDLKTGGSTQARKREFKMERRSARARAANPGLPEWYERPHYQTIAESKAYRNGVTTLLPQGVQLAWKQQQMLAGKTEVITLSEIDEKRTGVLRYAASKAISVDRKAVDELSYDEIAGLSDAAREGKAEAFVLSARALGIVAETQADPRQQARQATPNKAADANGKAASQPKETAKREDKKPEPPREAIPPIDDEPHAEHAFEAEPWNEFGDAAEFEDGSQARFTDPVEFARWFAEYLDTSDQPVRLLEYNSDIIDAASSHPEAAAIIVKARAAIDALDAEVAERAAAEEAAKAEWMSRVAVKVAIPDRSKFPWPKYLTGIIEALPAIKTKDALDEFVAIQDRYLNERLAFTETPTNKTWVGKIGLAIEAHRVELSKPPKVDQDQKRITDLVADLNKAETQAAYDLAVANAGRERVQTIVAGRPDLLRLVNEAADAARARIAKAQADQAPPQDGAPPNEGGLERSK